jgi:hypothetical protein
MRNLILSLLFCITLNSYAEGSDIMWVPSTDDTVKITRQFNQNRINLKKEKIRICINDYKEKQSKSYAKIVQKNLYDLMHNIDNISAVIRGKKSSDNDVSYEEKIEALAIVQCEAYYAMNAL